MNAKATAFTNKLNRYELIKDPVFVGRVIAIILILGITFGPNLPVFAQGGSSIGEVFSGLIESITEIVRTIAIGAGAPVPSVLVALASEVASLISLALSTMTQYWRQDRSYLENEPGQHQIGRSDTKDIAPRQFLKQITHWIV